MNKLVFCVVIALVPIATTVQAEGAGRGSGRAGALADEHLGKLQNKEPPSPAPVMNIQNLQVETLCAGIVGQVKGTGRLAQRLDGNVSIHCR